MFCVWCCSFVDVIVCFVVCAAPFVDEMVYGVFCAAPSLMRWYMVCFVLFLR